jgi:2-polyprenyl-3-methyl-5-hydroxy-6-metoxy-1,4-benzoquinol methylase
MEFDLGKIYNRRFRGSGSDASAKSRNNAWEILFNTSIKKYIDSEMTVLDLGSGMATLSTKLKQKNASQSI